MKHNETAFRQAYKDAQNDDAGQVWGTARRYAESYANSDEVKRRHWADLLDAIEYERSLLEVRMTMDGEWVDRAVCFHGEPDSSCSGSDYESLYRYLGLTQEVNE